MKEIFKKFIPDNAKLKQHKHLQWLGKYLQIRGLWVFNHRTISRAFAVGLFVAFVPLPFQMILAAIGAIIFSANLPVSIAVVWISNPITIPPIFYACYKLGAWILNTSIEQNFVFSLDYIWSVFSIIWQPFLLGCLVISIVSSLIGFWVVRLLFWINLSKYKQKKRHLQ